VLTPTRELAIQVAEAFQKYAAHMPGFHVLPIYGGRATARSSRLAARGVHVIVGTPGRIIDHLDRGTLDLSQLRHLVLDEADEMLRMGFIDDVEKILQEDPGARQVALFSATMPAAIRRIARPTCAIRPKSPSRPRPAPPTTSASATGWSAACTNSTRSRASSSGNLRRR
jgi:ATP-dependent RNA helicase DeaD